MRSINYLSINLLAVFLLALSGCGGGDFAPVSGTVLSDGEPVGKLRIMFSPEPVGDNHAVGPFSTGLTDAQGNFTLETRHGDPGAVVGSHTISCQYTDIGENAMGELRDMMSDAKSEGDQEQFQKAKQKMAEMKKKLKGRPILHRKYNAVVDIPAGGIAELKIEMSEMKPTGGNLSL